MEDKLQALSVHDRLGLGAEDLDAPGSPDRAASLRRAIARVGVVTRDFAARGAFPFKAHGLGRAPMNLLFELSQTEGASVSDLASRLHLTSGAVSQTVDALRAVGLVTSEVNPADRRGRIIRLTGEAWVEVDRFQQDLFDAIAPRFDGLRTVEIVELDRILALIGARGVDGADSVDAADSADAVDGASR